MTQSTEQERAEFLKANIRGPFNEALNHREQGIAFAAWQAASRAQVVPVGWSLPEAAQDALDWLEDDDVSLTHNIRERLRFALSKEPQPPEGLMSEKRTTKPEAAPVQMPEPFAITWHDSIQYPCGFPWFDRDKYPDGTKLYTEQQVRQLLADHGVK